MSLIRMPHLHHCEDDDETAARDRLHSEAVAWACRALCAEGLLNYLRPVAVRNRAEALVLAAEAKDVPIPALIAWIHERAPDKEWSVREFENWIEQVFRPAQAAAAAGLE